MHVLRANHAPFPSTQNQVVKTKVKALDSQTALIAAMDGWVVDSEWA